MYNLISLPSSICTLKGLVKLDVSFCSKLESLPEEIGDLENLEDLDASYTLISQPPSSIVRLNKLKVLNLCCCNIIDGGLPEDIGSLSSLKALYVKGNNFEHLPRSIAQLGALQSLHLLDCKRLTQLPEFPQHLDKIDADWSNDSICNSLFHNISSFQHDISDSGSLSLRVFISWPGNIPSWFHHRGMDASVSVNLPENWHKFALSNNSAYDRHFSLVPLAGFWDASKANGKTTNNYETISLVFGEVEEYGVRLLYKDEAELHIGIRRSRYEEASCSSSKKQRLGL